MAVLPDDAPRGSGGANLQGVRAHNERQLLTTIQRDGPLPGGQLARQLGLSAQTVSNILRDLEIAGLVERGDPQRGRVGKPSIPIGLASDGALSVGLKVGRRSAELALMGLDGTIRAGMQSAYRYPSPDLVLDFLERGLAKLLADVPSTLRSRVCGIGIAAPGEIWNWQEILGAPADAVESWRGWDIAAAVGEFTDLPVAMVNDATAACRAEHVFGQHKGYRDYAYLYVGALIGGGVVLDHEVRSGAHGNAGAFGPLRSTGAKGESAQLLDLASLYLLEDAVVGAGYDPVVLRSEGLDWSGFEPQVAAWLEVAAPAIASAVLSACSVIDFEAVVIDGAFAPEVRHRLVSGVQKAMTELDTRGVVMPDIVAGTVGADARVRGAAYGPIQAQYFLGQGPRLTTA